MAAVIFQRVPNAHATPRGKTLWDFAWEHSNGFWLLILTFCAAFLRLSMLKVPSIWGDEANTYSRVANSYSELIGFLQRDRFMPLHYELYWVIGYFFKLSPIMMRIVPALCGTLMVPAVYWLASQMVSRRAAFIAAGFTCCSAWMMFYSRDAKMYMELWLMGTLHIAALLWFLRTRLRVAWWAWVAAGVAMAGIHAPGLLLLAIEPLILLTFPKLHWKSALFFVLGLMIVAAGPIGYYGFFNEQDDRWGIEWVERRNSGHEPYELVKDTASAYFLCFNFIAETDDQTTPEPVLKAANASLITFAAILALGALPWPRRWRGLAPIGAPPPKPPSSAPDNLGPLASTLMIDDSALLDGAGSSLVVDAPPVHWWRSFLWLSIWLIVPVYGFYCLSFDNVPWPTEWIDYTTAGIALGLLAGCIALWIFTPNPWRTLGKHGVILITLIVTVFMLCLAVRAAITTRSHDNIWMPRYMGMVWPALAIIVGALLARLPTWPVRLLAMILVFGVNLVQSEARLFVANEPPVDIVAQDAHDGMDPVGYQLTFAPNPYSSWGGPSGGTLTNNSGMFYLYQYRKPGELVPHDSRYGREEAPSVRMTNTFELNMNASPRQIVNQVHRSDKVRRIVVWENADRDSRDDLLEMLGDHWKLVNERVYPVRVYWTWAQIYEYRRREYVKRDPADLPIPAAN